MTNIPDKERLFKTQNLRCHTAHNGVILQMLYCLKCYTLCLPLLLTALILTSLLTKNDATIVMTKCFPKHDKFYKLSKTNQTNVV